MRKRVALARTLIYEPETLLMDEPFGALDAQLKLLMLDQLQELTRQRRMTVVFVTHDLGEAITLADRVVVFSARPGRIRAMRHDRAAAAARRVPHPVHRGLRAAARGAVGRAEGRSGEGNRRMSGAERRSTLPSRSREGVGGRGHRPLQLAPSPQPPPARGGGAIASAPALSLHSRDFLRRRRADCRAAGAGVRSFWRCGSSRRAPTCASG